MQLESRIFLELEPQAKLNFARIDPYACDHAEVFITQRASRIAELGVVPDIKHFCSELDFGRFGRIPV